MKFNLEDLNPGTSFAWEKDAEVCLRICNSEALAAIRKQTNKIRYEFRGGIRYAWDDTDTEQQTHLIWDYVIVSWTGLVDKEGRDINCTLENKVKLMRGSNKFANFVTSCLTKLQDEENKFIEDQGKNS